MQKNFKRITVIALAFSMLIGSGAYTITASAAYTDTVEAFSYKGFNIPACDGDLYEEINGNKPTFTSSELTQTIYENYGALDSLGRVTVCEANIDKTLMPAEGEERGSISSVYPTGWKQNKYEFVNGKYLYNRSHLIGWQLTAENANKKNLMTGTRTFNASGMLPFENEVAAYVKAKSANNVLYRVTPVFQGDNLLASGVIMEAESVDDKGASVSFCVFVYNTEPGVSIDYLTGENMESGNTVDISAAFIYLESLKYTYTGKAIKPFEYAKLDGKTLTEGRDFTVSYVNNKKIGTATVKITGVYPYVGTAKKTFEIAKPVPKKAALKSVSSGKKAFSAKWKTVSGVSGYQIQYSLKKNFKNSKKVFVGKKSAKSKTVKNLKSKKVYYVRIRTYKIVNNTKFFSAWSRYKTVKTR